MQTGMAVTPQPLRVSLRHLMTSACADARLDLYPRATDNRTADQGEVQLPYAGVPRP